MKAKEKEKKDCDFISGVQDTHTESRKRERAICDINFHKSQKEKDKNRDIIIPQQTHTTNSERSEEKDQKMKTNEGKPKENEKKQEFQNNSPTKIARIEKEGGESMVETPALRTGGIGQGKEKGKEKEKEKKEVAADSVSESLGKSLEIFAQKDSAKIKGACKILRGGEPSTVEEVCRRMGDWFGQDFSPEEFLGIARHFSTRGFKVEVKRTAMHLFFLVSSNFCRGKNF